MSDTRTLTIYAEDKPHQVVRNALMLAAERYREHVKDLVDCEAFKPLRDQFERQAREANHMLQLWDALADDGLVLEYFTDEVEDGPLVR